MELNIYVIEVQLSNIKDVVQPNQKWKWRPSNRKGYERKSNGYVSRSSYSVRQTSILAGPRKLS